MERDQSHGRNEQIEQAGEKGRVLAREITEHEKERKQDQIGQQRPRDGRQGAGRLQASRLGIRRRPPQAVCQASVAI